MLDSPVHEGKGRHRRVGHTVVDNNNRLKVPNQIPLKSKQVFPHMFQVEKQASQGHFAKPSLPRWLLHVRSEERGGEGEGEGEGETR